LTKIINNKLNLDIRVITKFNINQRGKSGRIVDLIIDYIDAYQKNQELQLTNEYDIRFALHENFLYSSALIIQNGKTVNGIPENFILHGAGWGHGVGLCQIGALNLALNGVIYKSILRHYYPGTILKNLSEI
jgi:SpoIID/LytB domain protein